MQHGESVYKYYNKVIDVLCHGEKHKDVLIPEHLFAYADDIRSNMYDANTLKEYMLLHDCGKPYCRTVDAEGKQHFPEHACKSHEIYKQISDNETVANLILHDMDIHLLKADTMEQYLALHIKQQMTHLLVGLAELLSNAQMFGGIESTGFKIKYKSFCKQSKRILEHNFTNKTVAICQ